MAALDRPGLPDPATPYARLGLSPDATPAEVKQAYRRLAMQFHPDRAGEAGVAEFLAVKTAYETLRAHARFTIPGLRARSPATTGVVRRARSSGRAQASTVSPPSGARGPAWSGGRWYWEGLRANAIRFGRQQRTG